MERIPVAFIPERGFKGTKKDPGRDLLQPAHCGVPKDGLDKSLFERVV